MLSDISNINVNEDHDNPNLIDIFYKIIISVIIPLLLGICTKLYIQNQAKKYHKLLDSKPYSIFSKIILLLIIHQAFCSTFLQEESMTLNISIVVIIYVV